MHGATCGRLLRASLASSKWVVSGGGSDWGRFLRQKRRTAFRGFPDFVLAVLATSEARLPSLKAPRSAAVISRDAVAVNRPAEPSWGRWKRHVGRAATKRPGPITRRRPRPASAPADRRG